MEKMTIPSQGKDTFLNVDVEKIQLVLNILGLLAIVVILSVLLSGI